MLMIFSLSDGSGLIVWSSCQRDRAGCVPSSETPKNAVPTALFSTVARESWKLADIL
jgi:hypothetical protein